MINSLKIKKKQNNKKYKKMLKIKIIKLRMIKINNQIKMIKIMKI